MAEVALYGGGGAPFHHAAVLARAGHRPHFVFPVDIAAGALESFDAFVMPGGGWEATAGQLRPLGTQGAQALAAWVRRGGMYIGSCAGSYCAATVGEAFARSCPPQEALRLADARVWNEDESGPLSPGVGVLRARNVAPSHPVMSGIDETFEIVHYNGPFFSDADALAVVAGATDRFTPSESFLGEPGGATLVERAVEDGAANIVASLAGDGRVVLFGSHPEFGAGLAMDDEPAAARLLANAVEWQVAESGAQQRPEPALVTGTLPVDDRGPDEAGRLAEAIAAACAELRERGTAATWLDPRFAMATLGLEPVQIWNEALVAIERLSNEAAAAAPQLAPELRSFRQPAEWGIDCGFHGLVPLLEQTRALLELAGERFDLELGEPSPDPYAFYATSPFHLVAGSYLAAIGRAASAALLGRAFARA